MDFEEIKQILDMMREHELSEFELERDNFKLRVRKNAAGHWTTTAPASPHPAYAPAYPPQMPAPGQPPNTYAMPPAASVLTSADAEMELAVVKSPIVGTFFRASEPGAKPFTDVGERVKKGQVLCIIEAMKLMNDITAEIDGEVVKVYVENGQAVQYGERLLAIKPA
jgi:acetyl-CoA carboxylase biotin carboxyl carrier protein